MKKTTIKKVFSTISSLGLVLSITLSSSMPSLAAYGAVSKDFGLVDRVVKQAYTEWSMLQSEHPELVPVFRIYNPNSGEHLYTTNKVEYNHLAQIGWQGEGLVWYAPAYDTVVKDSIWYKYSVESTLVYRLYNRYSGEHIYTKDRSEVDQLVKLGWNDEGVAWYSGPPDGPIAGDRIYRLYNPNARGVYEAGAHLYTENFLEKEALSAQGWLYEGTGWHGASSATLLEAYSAERTANAK
ncbi:hypothetical protein FACS189418_8120 [Clostridia bacterium]|nr:hypothetical protein FACS189418_8120 [Clostridia bacterium]